MPPHIPVLPEEVLHYLAVRPGGRYVDCTAGAGGHAGLIAERMDGGALLALDRDPSAVALAGERLKPFSGAKVVLANYVDLAAVLEAEAFGAPDGILIDAGCSSMQLDQRDRGFSFEGDGPLDMRMNPETGLSAAEWLAGTPREELEQALRDYGDVKPARRIAAAIHERAARGTLNRTQDLIAAVKEALPFVNDTPAEVRTVFQAVRIAVNDELRGLQQGVAAAAEALAPGGRLVVISFHSGEDRVVKNALRDASRPQRERSADGRDRAVRPATMRLLTRQPVLAGDDELRANPRAASAKLRAAEKSAGASGGKGAGDEE
ncbi:MAG: 16S rRNA (cytosine(1402)-N(4))-methyltransferase RsmH [Candidatus Hydrogenedens sp.]|nr:16S rRNA (cytosine(1402)-N(4))-methyltransferase RsmH [Candidatus Hydrogenedens sp.]